MEQLPTIEFSLEHCIIGDLGESLTIQVYPKKRSLFQRIFFKEQPIILEIKTKEWVASVGGKKPIKYLIKSSNTIIPVQEN